MLAYLLGLYISFVTFSHKNDISSYPTNIQPVVFTPAPVVVPPVVPTKQVSLKIPYHRQIYTLSCEAASLQMTLAYRGIIKNQDQLLTEIGISQPFQSYTQNDTLVWGDPNLGFVGDVQGLFSTKSQGMRGATGWGVNNGPIGRVAATYRTGSEAYSNFTTADVVRELDDGNPIIFWHVPDSYASGSLTYQTPAGKLIDFFRNHVAVISGYKIIDGKTFFDISDPLYDTYILSETTLARRMAKYNGDVVVVR